MDSNKQIETGDLVAYLDGEATTEIQKQIEASPDLMQKAQALAQAEQEIAGQLADWPRPSTQELGEYRLGLLSDERTQEIDAYLKEHPHMAQELHNLQSFLDDVESSLPMSDQTSSNPLRLLLAKVRPMGNQNQFAPGMPGLRGDDELIYEADDVQVMIEVEPDTAVPTELILTGLLMGVDETETLRASIWRHNEPDLIALDNLDDLGNFTLANLTPNTYDLIISNKQSSIEIHIPNIEVT